jgi:hypothetical protein
MFSAGRIPAKREPGENKIRQRGRIHEGRAESFQPIREKGRIQTRGRAASGGRSGEEEEEPARGARPIKFIPGGANHDAGGEAKIRPEGGQITEHRRGDAAITGGSRGDTGADQRPARHAAGRGQGGGDEGDARIKRRESGERERGERGGGGTDGGEGHLKFPGRGAANPPPTTRHSHALIVRSIIKMRSGAFFFVPSLFGGLQCRVGNLQPLKQERDQRHQAPGGDGEAALFVL